MSKRKAQLVTAIIAAFVLLVCVDLVALYPKATIWILGAFAVPGAWKFCRTCYIWLTTEDQPVSIKLPFRKPKKPKGPVTYKDWADAQKGEQS